MSTSEVHLKSDGVELKGASIVPQIILGTKRSGINSSIKHKISNLMRHLTKKYA